MATQTLKQQVHRKLIDIPDEVFKTLNLKAAAMGTNLKKLIEDIISQEASDMEDAEVYRYLVSTRPEGRQMLSEHEQEDFEKLMGIKNKKNLNKPRNKDA